MARVSKIGSGKAYASVPLWWAAEAGIDYGAAIEAQCTPLENCGSNFSLAGDALYGAIIYTDGFLYDGSNASALSTLSRVNLDGSNITVKHLKVTNNNGFDYALELNGEGTLGEFLFIEDTSVSSLSYAAVRMDSANNKTLRNSTISATCAQLIKFGFDDPAVVQNITGWGAIDRGLAAAAGVGQHVTDVHIFDCNNAAFTGAYSTKLNTASDDATADYTPYGSAELVNFAGGDYRIKSTSFLATAGTGGSLIGAFLEAASGTTINLGFHPSESVINALTVKQDLLVSLPEIPSVSVIHPLDILVDLYVELGYTINSSEIYPLSILQSELVLLPFLVNSSEVFPLGISVDLLVGLDFFSNTSIVYPFTITGGNIVTDTEFFVFKPMFEKMVKNITRPMRGL